MLPRTPLLPEAATVATPRLRREFTREVVVGLALSQLVLNNPPPRLRFTASRLATSGSPRLLALHQPVEGAVDVAVEGDEAGCGSSADGGAGHAGEHLDGDDRGAGSHPARGPTAWRPVRRRRCRRRGCRARSLRSRCTARPHRLREPRPTCPGHRLTTLAPDPWEKHASADDLAGEERVVDLDPGVEDGHGATGTGPARGLCRGQTDGARPLIDGDAVGRVLEDALDIRGRLEGVEPRGVDGERDLPGATRLDRRGRSRREGPRRWRRRPVRPALG